MAGSGSGSPASSGFNQNLENTGLTSTSVTVPYAGPYAIQGKIVVPTLSTALQPSQVVVTVNQNGSPVYVGPAGAEGFYTNLSCAANDVIAVVLSSSAASDALPNVVKGLYSISQGQ